MENINTESKKKKKEKKITIKHFLNEDLKPKSDGKYPLYVKVVYDNNNLKIRSETNLFLSKDEFENIEKDDLLMQKIFEERSRIEEFLRFELKIYSKFDIAGFSDRYKSQGILIWIICVFYVKHVVLKDVFENSNSIEVINTLKLDLFHPLIVADKVKLKFYDIFREEDKYSSKGDYGWLKKDSDTPLDNLYLDIHQMFEESDLVDPKLKLVFRIKTFFELLNAEPQMAPIPYFTITQTQFTVMDALTDKIEFKFRDLANPIIKNFLFEIKEFLKECMSIGINKKVVEETKKLEQVLSKHYPL